MSEKDPTITHSQPAAENTVGPGPVATGSQPAPVATGSQIAKADKKMFMSVDLNVPLDQVPDLEGAELLPFDLITEYWTPEQINESKRVFFSHFETVDYPDQNTGEVKSLLTAFFLEKRKAADGTLEMVMICNATSVLVGRLQSHVAQGTVKYGTPLSITYLGKKKNSTNAFQSNSWSVKPVLIEIK